MSVDTAIERKRTWKQDPEGRRARVLSAAKTEFAAKGYQKARLCEIARAAGVAEGTIYHLFQSKRGLLEALGKEYGAGMALAAFGESGRAYVPSDVEQMVRNIFAYIRDTEGALSAFLLANDPAEGGPGQDANRARMLEAIEANIERWIANGQMPRVHARITAQIQFALVEGALRDCYLREQGENEEAYIRETVRILGASLVAPPPA